MYAGGGHADKRVSGLQLLTADQLALFANAYGEPGQVILVLRIKAGHLRGLAANQSTTGLHTALSHTGHDLLNLLREVFAAGNIIQEEQRLGTGASHIVNAHSHTVDTYGIVLIH